MNTLDRFSKKLKKNYQNLSSGSRVVPCGRTADETKLAVASRNFANAPKIVKSIDEVHFISHDVKIVLLDTGGRMPAIILRRDAKRDVSYFCRVCCELNGFCLCKNV